MIPPAGPPAIPHLENIGDVAILLGTTIFRLGHDHPLRQAQCVECRKPIDTMEVTAIGAAGLAYPACQYGCLPGSVFLIHANHLPLSDEAFKAAIRYGMECPNNH